jgi:hypothetical protein
MKNNRVDFIICYNDNLCYRECERYINALSVPSNIETGIIGISDAVFLTEGYNRAMHNSDARYKVYLHQDVFIINTHFIEDVLTIFKEDDSIGMIGVLGRSERDFSACYWKTWNIGRTYAATPVTHVDMNFQSFGQQIRDAVAIDGMMMITQYDVEWREDLLDGFDFYDISQSEEFLRAGYRIVVPFQDKPWCIHDCGVTKLTKYDYYRKVFCESYKHLGYKYEQSEMLDNRVKMGELATRFFEIAGNAFENGNYTLFDSLMVQALNAMNFSTDLEILFIFWKCLKMEWEEGTKESFFKGNRSIKEFISEYIDCRRVIRRIEFDKSDKSDDGIIRDYRQTVNGRIFLYVMITYCAIESDRVLKQIMKRS